MWYNKRIIRATAKGMLCTMTLQLVFPAVSSALTSGPSQPEVQGFEPVGTTDMVDMFSGDFVYNIPLMDVEGYPINISYHGGVEMEQEASWVGLGWNINPGVINRTVRGIPDDFNGETINKTIHIKPEKNIRVGVGGGAEIIGLGSPLISLSGDLGTAVNVSNYRGVSADISLGVGVNVAGVVSTGINIGVGSQSGADIDYNAGVQFNTSRIISSDVGAGVGVNYSSGYNTRTGLKDGALSFSGSISAGGATVSASSTRQVPIGVRNIVPVITNASTMTMVRGQIKLGGEVYWCFPHAYVNGMLSTLKFDNDGSLKSYGYLYAQNGADNSIMDFTRDRDGNYNKNMSFLPAGNMTYDIYSVSGQGTGGSFRPFRNDFGSVFDPAVSSDSRQVSVGLEAGIGNLFSVGADVTVSKTDITSGPWQNYQRPFTSRQNGSLYENTYFKQAGEVTETNPGLFSALQGLNPMDGAQSPGIPLRKPNSENMRDPRGNLIYYFTADEASKYGIASSPDLYNYTSTNGFAGGTNNIRTALPRVSATRKANHISEVVQVQTDGRRYVYGLPAMNTNQEEVTMAVNGQQDASGLVTYTDAERSVNNASGRDNFYTNTKTPPFAHSYLLTSVLSTDYVDVSGDGVTDDDFGSFTKFNYSLKNAAYGWKAPYGDHKAQFNAGFKSDKQDNKANVLSGTREQWLVHSVETKNFVAEFYTSSRLDARGVDTAADLSYKLDSIKLYNKHDRIANGNSAVPVKTVMFQYDYSLCPGVANNVRTLQGISQDNGKLTLKRIYVRYGNSQRSMISPYQFNYGNNYAYNFGNRDRWGAYKPSDPAAPNYDYPYVNQNDASLDAYAAAWSLKDITLPSGGTISMQYEADDYAYVMDRAAMEMFRIAGLGPTSEFSSGNRLYQNKDNPNLYLYFNRRTASEKTGLSPKDNYLKNTNILYYNAETRLTDNSYEPIKGYATVTDVGYCSDGTHGYVKIAPVSIEGGGASLNHISYTAINFARYYLPHIIFPGANPDNSSLTNVLAGLHYAFSELVNIAKNPVKRMTQEGKAQEINLATSFIRLNSPGLRKKGGGQRVKQIAFFDNWSKLAGGNTADASYGKTYDYTTQDQGGYGTISSGVASYEPQIGGDENPFREPVNYNVQQGGSFPPHDPVGLYQELPVGESLYPGASVGYSRVTVKSIHQQEGRSAQGEDVYDFYTGKDFPVQAVATPINKLADVNKYTLTRQRLAMERSQGYTLIFNDMHGKPKRTEHRVLKPGTGQSEMVSYKEYNYFTSGGKLSNDVPVMAYDESSQKMKRLTRTVGLEADITIDTREKMEDTRSLTGYANLNVSAAGIIPVPLVFGYPFLFNFKNEFRSVVATKVVQQYGILKEVKSSEEGALTTVRNEAFDPVTGQAVITSVNNEYGDAEYTVNYPAYWGYESMGPSYQNTGYTEYLGNVSIQNYAARISNTSVSTFKAGDELLMTYTLNGVQQQNNVWVMQRIEDTVTYPIYKCINRLLVDSSRTQDPQYTYYSASDIADTVEAPNNNYEFFGSNLNLLGSNRVSRNCGNVVLIAKPRFKYSWPQTGTLQNVTVKVIRSGAKNQLSESIQSYTGMSVPFDANNNLKDQLDKLISISAREYSDTITAILPKFDSLVNPTGFDSLNIYVNGTRQVKRLSKEYAYIKNRTYTGTSARNAGLFTAPALWRWNNYTLPCVPQEVYCMCQLDPVTHALSQSEYYLPSNGPVYAMHITGYTPATSNLMNYTYLAPHIPDDPNWTVARTVTKYSPWGFELENKDAIGNYTTALYGYNQQLPVALAQNARQHDILAEGFEDYALLQAAVNYVPFSYSPLNTFFNLAAVANSTKYNKFVMSTSANGSVLYDQASHTGRTSLKTYSVTTLSFNVAVAGTTGGQPRYQPFSMEAGRKYIVSYWMKPVNPNPNPQNYTAQGMQPKSRIIEGWQQMEAVVTATGSSFSLNLPGATYIDDLRIFPQDANMKAFVYHPVNQKLVATLDENNFATFYEYDQEGNLVRTKKETEKGISTIMESRSANKQGAVQ